MARWLEASEAAARLGVKPATLYAYVSRGQVRRRSAPDGRRSEYHADDVADLAVRGRRARPVRPSDIVLPTAVTSISPDGPRYRGVLATEMAGTVAFERVAEHLWAGTSTPRPHVGREPVRGWEVPPRLREAAARAARGVADGDVPAAAVPAIVAAARTADPLRDDLRPTAVTAAARGLIAVLATGVSATSVTTAASATTAGVPTADTAVPTPSVAGHLAGRWIESDIPSGARGETPPMADVPWIDAVQAIDTALVLLADHELAASTLAVRVAASSRCDPYAVVLAGVAVLSGPRHGAASRPMERALRAAASGTDPEEALAAEQTAAGAVPGFGHPLYPDGDPRGARLLAILRASTLGGRCTPLFELIGAAERRGLDPPNIDTALAGLTFAIGAPVGTGELLFTIARTAGWIAHALEQYEDPRLLRPRAVYTGP